MTSLQLSSSRRWFLPLLLSARFLLALALTGITLPGSKRPARPSVNRAGIPIRSWCFRVPATALSALPSDESTKRTHTHTTPNAQAPVVAIVLGGSGFVGRRVCQALATGGGECVSRVVSVSRSGRPPASYLSEEDDDNTWSDRVEWIRYDLAAGGKSEREGNSGEEEESVSVTGDDSGRLDLAEALAGVLRECKNDNSGNTAAPIDLAIVGCIGNANPSPTWTELWGLGFDQDRLLLENGGIYQTFVREALLPLGDDSVRVRRCVMLSLDYNSQKCLEGPLEGYVEGKRLAERTFLEAVSTPTSRDDNDADSRPGNDDVIVLGLPCLVHGGRRFPGFGKLYRNLVESPIARAYVRSNRALRSLSKTTNDDWVEEMWRGTLFSSPIGVDAVGELVAAAANGLVTRDMVNDGKPRKQGFFDTSGLPIEYDDVLFVDGARNIEKVLELVRRRREREQDPHSSSPSGSGTPPSGNQRQQSQQKKQLSHSPSSSPPPLWEGALIGKRPYLYPLPVALMFATFFWGVVTGQFVKTHL
eukprot:jgi/Psemu1/282952/fgenesh1_pg.17_\